MNCRGAAKKPKKNESKGKAAPTSVGGGSSANYVADLYTAWKRDPTCVHTVSLYFFQSTFNFFL